MSRLIAVIALLLLSTAARAACPGTDLIAAMPQAKRDALRIAALAHPYPEGILWRADKDGRQIHLVGTMHLYDPRHDITLNRIDPMLSMAAHVFLEVGEGDQQRLQRMIADDPDLAFLTEGPTLPDLLGEDDWDRLRTALADRGVPGFLAAKMKPWMALANLGLSRCDFENIRLGRLGLDSLIIKRAAALGTPPVALEPIETAFQLFSEFTQAEQIELLRLGLAQQVEDSADQAVTLTEAYFREDIQLIWEFSMSQAADIPGMTPEALAAQTDRLEELLVTRRNKAWMDLILSAKGDTLIAVGAMHLPGEHGLLFLLAQAGFAVERLEISP